MTYILVNEGTGTDIDPEIYTIELIDDPNLPSLIKITVNDPSFVDQYTPDDPLEMVVKAKVGPTNDPYDE